MATKSATKSAKTAKPIKAVTKSSRRVSHGTRNQLSGDALKNAALLVSLGINLYVLCIWVTLQITSYYDDALVKFFIHR